MSSPDRVPDAAGRLPIAMALYTASDHRGVRVGLGAVLADFPPVVDPHAAPADVRKQIEARLAETFTPREWVQFVPIVGGGVLSSLTVVGLYRGQGLSLAWAIPIGAAASFGVTVALAAVLRRRFGPRRSTSIIDAFLEARRCPACGYDLAVGVAQDDGCAVCPECGAAWRLPGEPGSATVADGGDATIPRAGTPPS